ncbi:MAG: hypothetical protein HY344_04370 [Candidatus Levybacteria bacterium]|nr:hypothetical protein [Candidatus Levybacteria bacterium]
MFNRERDNGPHFVRRRNMRPFVSAAVALSIASTAGVGEYSANDPFLLPRLAQNFLQDACPVVPSEAARIVDFAFNRKGQVPSTDYGIFKQFAQNKAKELGLTLVEVEPYLDQLYQASTTREVLDLLNAFTSNFSFSVEVPSGMELKDVFLPYKAVDFDSLDFERLKSGTEIFMSTFNFVPVEIVRASEIRKVKIVDESPFANGMRTAGVYEALPDTMILPLHTFYNGKPHVIIHELGHGVDTSYCGMFVYERDPEYRHLNPDGFVYGSIMPGYDRYVVSKYSTTKMYEDKAEIYADILTPFSDYRSYTPVQLEKAKLLLARLEAAAPSTAEYLLAINVHNYKIVAEVSSSSCAPRTYPCKS